MDGSDCRGYRTTRRNLPSSIAYRPPFTAISRNIGVIDMQTSHTTASAAATTSLARRIVAASWKPVLFAVLMWLSAAAGEIPIPGTPVPITLQTFVVMLAGLMLPWRQAGAAVATYLAAGAVGLPVFAGGTSTLALVGPSALSRFCGVVVIACCAASPTLRPSRPPRAPRPRTCWPRWSAASWWCTPSASSSSPR